jgi:hypothetical protein
MICQVCHGITCSRIVLRAMHIRRKMKKKRAQWILKRATPNLYSLRSILVVADSDVSIHKICFDLSKSTTTIMERRKYMSYLVYCLSTQGNRDANARLWLRRRSSVDHIRSKKWDFCNWKSPVARSLGPGCRLAKCCEVADGPPFAGH